jgi:hypothetical protein
MGTVRAKMAVNQIVKYLGGVRNAETGKTETRELHTVKMNAVYGGSPEDNTFAEATPSATLDISITNPETVGFFELGKHYYVDFSRVGD